MLILLTVFSCRRAEAWSTEWTTAWTSVWTSVWTYTPSEGCSEPTTTAEDTVAAAATSSASNSLDYNGHGDWSTTYETEGSATSAATDPASTSTDGDGTNGSGASDMAVQEYIQNHNTLRAQYSAGNLEWNNTLAATAQQWSNNCVFEHSNGTLGPYGGRWSQWTVLHFIFNERYW